MKLRITVDGRAYAVEVELIEEEEAEPSQEVPYAPAAHAPSPAIQTNADPGVCRSPVNGLVFKVLVEAGQCVEAGAVVLILEAMKMETHVVAPRAATVKAVHVRPGDPVKLNEILVEFE